MTYNDLYQTWLSGTSPSATKSRMTRTTLKYLAAALERDDWSAITAMPQQQAMVLLNAALAMKDLQSQSRSNYRNYLRHLYRFAAEEGIDVTGNDDSHLWPTLAANNGVPRRARVAYDRFVKWAIGRGIWPGLVRAGDLVDWACRERDQANQHWRKDYDRLTDAWRALVMNDGMRPLDFESLPAKRNNQYAFSIGDWPGHLREAWSRMCDDASVPLRKGGMRPWRPITREQYEKMVALFLGWVRLSQPERDFEADTWASLLTADNCQAYVNWLVVRNGKGHLNPSHTAFLRMVRGFHRFLLGSGEETVESFNAITMRCETHERDKAVRMVPYPTLEKAFRKMVTDTTNAMRACKKTGEEQARVARLQVDAVIFGLLVGRVLRSANIRGIRIGTNLVRSGDGFDLRFNAKEMKGHRKFESSCPEELAAIIEDYLRRGYRALTGRSPIDGDVLLVNGRGHPFDRSSFGTNVKRLSRRLIGKPINAHLYRHIVATHAAQVWKLTPTELAAFLGHRSRFTCMKYYEVTNPVLAASRVDKFRRDTLSEST